jgi:hypothetical protein
MSQAVVDPGEVRRFAHQLKQFTGELLNQMAVVQRQVAGLGSTWRDQEHKKFMEDFEQQRAEYGLFLDPGRLGSQMQDFTGWHRDITQRERELEIQHAINVFAAHNQVAKRKSLDPNQTALASPAP